MYIVNSSELNPFNHKTSACIPPQICCNQHRQFSRLAMFEVYYATGSDPGSLLINGYSWWCIL